jgi:hypothetical protein
VDAFFRFFNAAHPFLLPRDYLSKLLSTRNLQHLVSAMQFIGSYYIPNASTEAFKVVAKTALFEQHPPSDGFSVQAMLLYAMGLHIGTDFQAADQTMELVVKMALDLGMNRNSFAISNGEGSRVMEESWRRTWWELYVTDGIFASIRESGFQFLKLMVDVPLPCEEIEYLTGVRLQPL